MGRPPRYEVVGILIIRMTAIFITVANVFLYQERGAHNFIFWAVDRYIFLDEIYSHLKSGVLI